MIDTHCHLNNEQFLSDLETVVQNFLSSGVEKAICVGWDIPSSVMAKAIAESIPSVYYEVGVHPDECDSFDAHTLEDLITSADNKLVAVGEIGLDFFHNKNNKQKQKEVFIAQIELAIKHKLPIVVHCRDAMGETLKILKKYAPFSYGCVMHCYSGSLESALELISLGVKLSFTGTVTFKNAHNLHEVIKNIPLETFFFETDCPYLAPEPIRGTRNEPKNVKEIVKFVAQLRNMDEKTLIVQTDKNAKDFFGI